MAGYYATSVAQFDAATIAVAGVVHPAYTPNPVMELPYTYIQFYDVATGALIWELGLGGTHSPVSSMVMHEGLLYVGSEGGTVQAWQVDPVAQMAAERASATLPAVDIISGLLFPPAVRAISFNASCLMVYTGERHTATAHMPFGQVFVNRVFFYDVSMASGTPTFTLVPVTDRMGGPLSDCIILPQAADPPPATPVYSNTTGRYSAVPMTSKVEVFPGTPEWNLPGLTSITSK